MDQNVEIPPMEHNVEISPVTQDDLLSIFNLSNLDSVRAASFNTGKIDLSGHQKWFAEKMADPNTVMVKAVLGEDFAGQARLSMEGAIAVIGVSVDEKFRGRGIASKLLQAAIEEAGRRGIEVIEAFIKPENLASIKLFEKAGFVLDQKTEVSGNDALKYVYKIN